MIQFAITEASVFPGLGIDPRMSNKGMASARFFDNIFRERLFIPKTNFDEQEKPGRGGKHLKKFNTPPTNQSCTTIL